MAEIKAAIERLSPNERDELESWLHPDWNVPLPYDETPPGVREKLAEAGKGKFFSGNPANLSKILATLK